MPAGGWEVWTGSETQRGFREAGGGGAEPSPPAAVDVSLQGEEPRTHKERAGAEARALSAAPRRAVGAAQRRRRASLHEALAGGDDGRGLLPVVEGTRHARPRGQGHACKQKGRCDGGGLEARAQGGAAGRTGSAAQTRGRRHGTPATWRISAGRVTPVLCTCPATQPRRQPHLRR